MFVYECLQLCYWSVNWRYFAVKDVASWVFWWYIFVYYLEHYPVSGPSYTLDTGCSSSMYAIEHAYRAMRDGLCDSAIVGGCNLCLHPHMSIQFFRAGCPQLSWWLHVIWQRWYASFIIRVWHVHSYYNECGVNVVLLYVYRQDVDCRCCRTFCWWDYLDLRVRKWQEFGDICLMVAL